jgi:hypothetical protein
MQTLVSKQLLSASWQTLLPKQALATEQTDGSRQGPLLSPRPQLVSVGPQSLVPAPQPLSGPPQPLNAAIQPLSVRQPPLAWTQSLSYRHELSPMQVLSVKQLLSASRQTQSSKQALATEHSEGNRQGPGTFSGLAGSIRFGSAATPTGSTWSARSRVVNMPPLLSIGLFPPRSPWNAESLRTIVESDAQDQGNPGPAHRRRLRRPTRI